MSEHFGLGTFAYDDGSNFVGLVQGQRIACLKTLHAVYQLHAPAQANRLSSTDSLGELLSNWERNFPILQLLAEFAVTAHEQVQTIDPATLRYRQPLLTPGKILHSAANYREHVTEMEKYNVRDGNVDPTQRFAGNKVGAKPYLFLKASSALTGPFDDIAIPHGEHQIDWEAELAVVIGRVGKRISAAQALDHVAGYMATNDVTCRDLLWRGDRPNFRTDWLASKSHDSFAPMGPLFIPRQFVGDPGHLRITLKVNGVTKQDGETSGMIFSAEEQIEFASSFMTLHPGDIFVTGTLGGVGQASGEFLKAGDVMETQVQGVGMLRNRFVAQS